MHWVSLFTAELPAFERQSRQPALFRQEEGRCSRYGGAIFAHFWCWELTHLFIFSSSVLFDRRSH